MATFVPTSWLRIIAFMLDEDTVAERDVRRLGRGLFGACSGADCRSASASASFSLVGMESGAGLPLIQTSALPCSTIHTSSPRSPSQQSTSPGL